MENINDKIVEIRKYLKKLVYIINNDAHFSLFNKKYINKNKVDDIWVCIEANFPEEYKKLIKQKTHKRLKSINLYHSLKNQIHNKSKLFASSYAIHYQETLSLIGGFGTLLESDFKLMNNGTDL